MKFVSCFNCLLNTGTTFDPNSAIILRTMIYLRFIANYTEFPADFASVEHVLSSFCPVTWKLDL